MEDHFPDNSFEDYHDPASLSTLASEGSLDDPIALKQDNQKLPGKLKEMTQISKTAKHEDIKEEEIETQNDALPKMTEEIDSVKQKVEKIGSYQKIVHKPVSNPLQAELINHLRLRGAIKSKRVEEVMRSIDRGDFAPRDPYVDRPQPIGFNTTISAPHMHATQLEILKGCFKKAKKAVDIGTGSGYVALSLAKMMKGYKGKVYALDHIPKLVEQAQENISKNHIEYIEDGRIEFVVADGREGLPEHAPFDVIFVGGAVKEIPECLIEQLADDGSMLIPVGHFFQDLLVVHKTNNGEVEITSVMPVMFGRLQSVEKQCPDIDD